MIASGAAPGIDPHRDARTVTAGVPPGGAAAVLVLLHGRGATAESMLPLGAEIGGPAVSLVALQAAERSWYPRSFLARREGNEPWLSSALDRVGRLVEELTTGGVEPRDLVLVGFSQGACLASEFVARHPRRYGGLAALTGGLVGETIAEHELVGDLAGTPVLLASGDPDPHVPWSRVEESAAIFRRLGAAVDLRRYPGLPHGVDPEEIELARRMVEEVAGRRALGRGARVGRSTAKPPGGPEGEPE